MPQFRDQAGNIWEGTGPDDPNLRLVSQGGGQAVVLPAAPPKPQEAPARTEAGGATEGLKAGYMWVDPSNPSRGQVKIPIAANPDLPQNRERTEQIKTILSTIQRIRKMADENLAVGSTAEFLQNTPILNQNVRNVQAATEQLRGDIIQQQLAILAEANQGGVASLANSVTEAERMAASIAPLNVAQSQDEFLAGLQNAEDYYLRQAATIEGKPAPDAEIQERFLPKDRVAELRAVQPEQTQLSSDGTAIVPIPDWYQQEHFRYLSENKDNFDGSQYAAFRAGLDERAGLTPNLPAYVKAGEGFREFFKGGGQPQQLGAVPPAQRNTSQFEQNVTNFAQTPFGAGTLAFTNSATAGLIPAIAGKGEEVEAVRQNQPLASFVGDVGGGIAGSMMLGGGLGAMGARGLLANPMVQNAGFSAVQGATQSEDPLMGAAIGAAGALGGDVAGRYVGQQLPGMFAPTAMREARESVPTSGELGNQADRMYRAAAAQGQMIQPAQTNRFIDDTEQFLRQSGYMTQQGDLIGTGPVQDATRILQSFRDQPIGPMEAQTLRNKIADGRTAMREGAPDNQARMFSGDLTNQFDQFAEAQNALPGIAAAREVAQRRIMGRELQTARELGQARGDINYSQGGEDLGIRRAFGALDTADVRGARMYPQAVQEAIQVVSRGTPARNVARAMSRLSPQGGGGLLGGAMTGAGIGAAAGDALTGGAVTGTLYGAGLLGRFAGGAMTRGDAELAELTARGGPQFQQMLAQAREEAAIRAGRVGAGLFGSTVAMPFRDY